MAPLFNPSGILPTEKGQQSDKQIRKNLTEEYWSRISPNVVASMSKIRKESMQSTIDKIVNTKMESISGTKEKIAGSKALTPPPSKEASKAPKTRMRLEGLDYLDPKDLDVFIGEEIDARMAERDLISTKIGKEMGLKFAKPEVPTKPATEKPTYTEIDPVYDSFVNAETASVAADEDSGEWWRRTIDSGNANGGSSAFGPVQITRKLFREARDNFSQYGITDEELKSLNFYIDQGDQFLKYGNEPDKEGYSAEFDYSGVGDNAGRGYFADTETGKAKREQFGGEDLLKEHYKSIAKKIMGKYSTDYQGNEDEIMKAWRFGASSDKTIADDDPDYGTRYNS